MNPLSKEVRYRVNHLDEIVSVNEAWDAFAADNCGAHLTAPHVIGRPLWDFIADRTTCLVYRDVLARARHGHPVRFDFRCDAPDCRRRLQMEVIGEPDDCVEFRVRPLSEEPRPMQPLLDPAQPHSEALLRVCGWCKKVDVGNRWVEVEEAVPLLRLFEKPRLPDITHGICEACYLRMLATLDDELAS